MATTNHDRVGQALRALSIGLAPFVARECEARYGRDWAKLTAASSQLPGRTFSTDDVQFQLKVMWDTWNEVFRVPLGRAERTFVSELMDARNKWAHQGTFTTDDAYRMLDTAHRLLLSVSAGSEAEEVDRLRQDLLRTRFAEQARQTQRRAAVLPIEGQPAGGLRPWREVITPHPDVASGRYQQAEFAADLHQVWRDEGVDEYRDPVEFFRRTFLTDGLRQLLINAVRRFRKEGGDPVVELQTNFGGGKTHSLIALFHLAAGYKPSELPGVESLLAGAHLDAPPAAKAVVLVGHKLSPGKVNVKPDGTEVRTMWGEMAWQLGRREGFEMVAEADRTGTNPGADLVDLLQRFSPCLILIDEWVAYARQLYGVDGLPAGSFDAQFTFAQALAEAVKAVEGALLVVSIPSSDIEVGGDGGRAALERLKNVIGRVEASWRPASAEEGFEIVRRRLFEDIPAENAPDRDAVVKAFGSLYRAQKTEFPRGCSEADYERRITNAYPIHPEMFDRLYGEWSTLEKFQRTRGVLRLMAAVICELWQRNDASLLVMPATIPIDSAPVAAELTRYLDDSWTPVIESDIDGPNALPLRLDGENPNLGRYSATRRVARTIYLGSAPTQQAANQGIDDQHIKLGCVQPGEAPATFGDALRRLTDRATYLYVDGQRYWYALQPSVTRTAQGRAEGLSQDEVQEEVRRRLIAAARNRGDFASVQAAPGSPAEVPDEDEVRLVILGPENAHSSKTDDSTARAAAERLLDERAGGARLHRNMLVFLAADTSRLEELGLAVRQFMAWSSIHAESATLNLDNFQRRQAETKQAQFDEAVNQRIGETYVWVLTPSQVAGDPTVVWKETRVAGGEALAVRVSRKLATEEELITTYSGARLRMDMDRVPLWRGEHVSVKQLWADYTQYMYLPRLRDSQVLLAAISDGAASTSWSHDGFAYASASDPKTERYLALTAGKHAAVTLDSEAVVVKAEAAMRQIENDREAVGEIPPPTADQGLAVAGPLANEEGAGHQAAIVHSRFYGRTKLQTVRALRDMGEIADAIIQQLSRVPDAQVVISLEIEATSTKGFDADVRRTVTENARTLKFETHEFEGD